MKPVPEHLRKYQKAKELVRPFIDMAVSQQALGVENIPDKGGFILAANHRSDLDPLIISAQVERFMVWIAASYVFKIPFVGRYLEELGTIPISGAKKDQIQAFKQVSKTLRKDRILGIFPEGHDYMLENDFSKPTRTFHSGFARFALKLNKPVLPTAIIGIEERPEPIPVPAFIREMLGFPQEVLNVKNRLIYKKTLVVYGKVIPLEPYREMEMEQAVKQLTRDTKAAIDSLIQSNAPVERRSAESGRRSGTRIAPES
jgi:1-acyl-sn-glycerol-3-phosphate acyltransferase